MLSPALSMLSCTDADASAEAEDPAEEMKSTTELKVEPLSDGPTVADDA